MCGIAGIFDTSGIREIDRAILQAMNEAQHHRGPDEGSVHLERGLGLGHRRLSIIDVASGLQPLFNEDESVAIVFNGEIYNFQQLASELKAAGHAFRTHCDTEVIVHAWEEWGETCVQRLRGMFSFAIWDRNRKTLFLARDRVGIKPMHYALLDDGTFLFGSELKAVLAYPSVPRHIDCRAVEDYFAYGYIPDPKTIYKNIFKLQPGHTIMLKVGQQGVVQKKYWDVPFSPVNGRSEADVQAELAHQLRDAVSSHLVSEVPLGAFLSGGVDSGAVVATMAQMTPHAVNTCSIGFDDPKFDESKYAAMVAKRYDTDHQTETVKADQYDLVDRLARLYDEPYADSSAIPTYRVCQAARKRVTVALSGDGGDETFAGYRRYRYAMAEHGVRSRIPAALRKPLFGVLGRYYPKADWAPRMFRAKTTFEALSRDLVEGYFHGVSTMPDRVRKELFSDSFQRELQGYRAVDVMTAHAKSAAIDDPLSMLQYLDFKTYLPGDILTKVDRASMAHSLEVRVPLLDHQFVEWAGTVPSDLKLKRGEGKYIFKKSLEAQLPGDILYRPKMGFSIPLAAWFRGPLKETVRKAVLSPLLLQTGIFNETYLRHMLDAHQAGHKDYSVSLWSVLMFEAFLRTNGATA